MRKLDVVNECLATLGESALVSLDDNHPLVPAALVALDNALVSVLSHKWWFNSEYINLYPANGSKFIYVPEDTIDCSVLDRRGLTIRGRRLYDRFNSTYEITGVPVQALLHRFIPYEDLPMIAKQLVKVEAVIGFQVNFDADKNRTASLERKKAEAYYRLNAQHIREMDVNVFEISSIAGRRYRAGALPNRRGHRRY